MASQALKLVKKTLRHMDAMSSGHQVGGILLAGDPGIGKTTFISMLGKLLGMKTIVIEVPHITEEHLINIPFIVFNPQGGKESGTTEIDSEYKLVLAQSNLFTQMTSAAPMSDANYLSYMKSAPRHVQELFKALGGSEDTIPPSIAEARKNHKSILFLDEYYRQASTRIRNIMRGILNGNIGMHKIPKDVYIMYASNMRDGGVESIPSNHQFNAVEYKAPTKDDWFDYLISEYEGDNRVKLNHTVLNKFKALLEDEDISHSDMAVEVRTSPRRWEQLIMYINNAIPVADRDEARALITNVRNNFIHYQTEEYGDLAEKVTKAVAELITETSDGKVTAFGGDSLEHHEWRSALQHAVDAQIKAGGTRKHIPVVSGPPGIGKAQPLHSMIKTPTGWTTMGEVSVGDVISTPSGDTALVDGIFTQDPRMVYKVTFADGRTAEACAEHLWKVKKDREATTSIVSTSEIQRLLTETNRWVYIPLVTPIEVESKSYAIAPYLLGAMLGDGGLTNACMTFSTADQQMLDNLESPLAAINCKLNYRSNYDYSIVMEDRIFATTKCTHEVYLNPLKTELSKMGLLGKNSYNKFIPEQYFSASLEQKEQLLAGLVDTDGCVSKTGSLSISTSSETLAHDIQRLVWSMGGIAKMSSKIPSYTYKGARLDGATSYTVSIRYKNPTNLSKLDRKRDRLPTHYQYANLNLRITAIEEVSVQPVQCISVNHPDHLYITDNFVVTHNTTQAAQVALKHNLRLIELDVGELYAEDAIGMPIPGERSGDKINVKFSVPKLFHQINSIIKTKDEAYEQALKEEYGAGEGAKKFKEYSNQRWKYLIFFDELNRVDEKTFNALRKVVLEKNFGPSGDKDGSLLELPKEAVVVAAINPEGVGTTELTQHFRDVIDVIPAKASWDNTKTWLMSKNFKGVPDEVKTASMSIIQAFIDKFKTGDANRGRQQQPFYLDLGGAELYISPREYTDMFATIVREMNSASKDALKDADISAEDLRDEVDDAVGDAMEDSLNMIFYKHEVEKDEFMDQLKKWIRMLPDSMFSGLITRVAQVEENLTTVLAKYLDGHDLTSMPDDAMFVNNNNNINNAQFIDQIKAVLTSKLRSEESVKEHIVDQTHDKITLSGDDLKPDPSQKTSLLANFAHAILYSLHIHEYSHDRIQQVGRAVSQAMTDVRKQWTADGKLADDVADDASTVVLELRTDLMDVVDGL